MNPFHRFIFAVVLFLCLLAPASAKDGKAHTDDMLKVLGLYSLTNSELTAQNRRIMAELTTFFNDSLDSRGGDNKVFYDKLKKQFPLFNYGGGNDYGHRLLYHWGFEYGDPENQAALKLKFKEKYPNEVPENAARRTDFIRLVKEEQGKRNMILRNKTDSFFALSGARQYSRGIAGLLYYTHLLGDHIEHTENHTKTVEAVLPVSHIVKNLDSYVRDLSAHGNQGEYQNWKQTIKVLEPAVFATNENYAQAVLDALFICVPPLLERNLGSTFLQKGLTFAK